MRTEINGTIVALSLCIAFIGAYAAITVCEQFRTNKMGIIKSRYMVTELHLIMMAACLGGVGIWCMHFIGMSSMNLVNDEGKRVEVRYEVCFTIFSLILVLLFTWAGVHVSACDPIFAKPKREVLDMFTRAASTLKRQGSQQISVLEIFGLLSSQPVHLFGGGALTGTGVLVMHYMGMAAMRFQGRIEWDGCLILASVLIAYVASTAAFWILFRLLSLFPTKEVLRVACACVMACAVCGMHYVGMLAGKFVLDERVPLQTARTVSESSAFVASVSIAAALVFVCMLMSLADLRYSVIRLSTELYKADDLIKHLPVTPHSNAAQTIVRYIAKRKLNSFSVGVLNDTPATRHVLDEEEANNNKDAVGAQTRSSSLLGVFHVFTRSSSSVSNLYASDSGKVAPTTTASTCSAATMLSAATAAASFVNGFDAELDADVELGEVRQFSTDSLGED